MNNYCAIVTKCNDTFIICCEGYENELSSMYDIMKVEFEQIYIIKVAKSELDEAKKDIDKLNDLIKSKIQ